MRLQFSIVLCFIIANTLNGLNQQEQECYDLIFRPAELSHNIIQERVIASYRTFNGSVPDDTSSDSLSEPLELEVGIPERPPFDVDPDIVRALAKDLSGQEIQALGTIMKRFVDYLQLEQEFHDAYNDQLKNIRYTIVIGGASLIALLIALIPLGLSELAQMRCDDYECVFDDDSMIITENGDGPTHYCAHDGQDFDCLQFFATALGNVDLTQAVYKQNCTKEFDESLVNQTIPLAQIKHFSDTTCQVLVGLVPLLDAVFLAIPATAASYTIKKGFDLKKLRHTIERIKQEPEDFDSWTFRMGLAKIENISPNLKTYVELAGNTFSIGSYVNSPIERLFHNSPFHILVEELLKRAGFGNTIKTAWKEF